jgi:flagellar basal body rod protein FlgG
MNSQLYVAASGLLAEARRVEMTANNLANVSTNGYRAQRTFSRVYEGTGLLAPDLPRLASQGVALGGAYQVPGPGALHPTGRALDVALEPDAVLAVDTPAGRRYTRDGALVVSPAGRLVTADGHAVLGTTGAAIEGLTPAATITADGRVIEDAAERGRLLVLRDASRTLVPAGGSLLLAADAAALETIAEPRLGPGWLESSSANALEELALLMEAQRAFEGYQRIVALTMNDVNTKAVTQIAG